MEVDAFLDKFLDWSLRLDVGVAVGLQVSDIGDGNIQEPKDNIRALLVDYHDVVGPNDHDCQGYAEEDGEDDDGWLCGAGDRHCEALKRRVDASVVVMEEEFGVVEDEAVVVEEVQDEALCPDQGRL